MVGVLPAQQGLGGENAALRVYLRLVMQDELLLLQGQVQVLFELAPVTGRLVHARGEELNVVAPGRLRVIHRSVGILHEDFHALAVGGEDGDADARGRVQSMSFDLVGPRQRLENLACHALGRQRVGPGEHDDEFVTAETGDDVAVAHAAAQPRRNLQQECVADVVTEGVVDVLEPIEIEEHHGHRTTVALASRRGQRLIEASLQVRAVGEIRQRVEMRQVADLLLGRLALGDVDETADVVFSVPLGTANRRDR